MRYDVGDQDENVMEEVWPYVSDTVDVDVLKVAPGVSPTAGAATESRKVAVH